VFSPQMAAKKALLCDNGWEQGFHPTGGSMRSGIMLRPICGITLDELRRHIEIRLFAFGPSAHTAFKLPSRVGRSIRFWFGSQ
jgi:hypothetical protein